MSTKIKNLPQLRVDEMKGYLKLPTGGLGDVSITVQGIVDWIKSLDLFTTNKDFKKHTENRENPHKVTKEQVGLGFVNNTSDLNKPISNSQSSVNKYLIEGISSHISNHDNPHNVTKQQIGLGNVDNTSDLDKPISDLTKTYVDDRFYGAANKLNNSYETLAIALTHKSDWKINSSILITNDGDKSGIYLWDGVNLKKSQYDPLEYSKTYTDEEIAKCVNFTKDLVVNKGSIKPFVPYLDRNSVNIKEIIQIDALKNTILDIRIVGAKEDCVYRLGYYGNGYNGSYTWQFEEVKKDEWGNTPNYFRVTRDVILRPQYNTGIQTYELKGTYDKSLSFFITIDTDVALQYENQEITMWRQDHSGYCWIIDPQNYQYTMSPYIPKEVTINSEGLLTQGSWFMTPFDEFSNVINASQNPFKPSPILQGSIGQCIFNFPEILNTNGRTTIFPKINSYAHEIPFTSIKAFTPQSSNELDMWSIVRLNQSGILRFNFHSTATLFTIINGSLTILRKLPESESVDNYSKVQVVLALIAIANPPKEELRPHQWIGLTSASEQSKPFKLVEGEFQQIVDNENDGLWVKHSMNICKDIMLNPRTTYAMRLEFRAKSGVTPQMKNTDIKITSGSLCYSFDSAQHIRTAYPHRFQEGNYENY